jgi:ADP-ribose pyrophosphatase YjhB (NUDIX family)
MNEKEFLASYRATDFDLLSLAVDIVIFGVEVELAEDTIRRLDRPLLKILLVKRVEHPFCGCRSLPGGFVGISETLEDTANRIIAKKTGLGKLYLEQLYTFGDPGRDPRARVISCSYLALVGRTNLTEAEPGDDSLWFSIALDEKERLLSLKADDEEFLLPLEQETIIQGRITTSNLKLVRPSPLAFDHGDIILAALTRLRGKIDYTDLIFSLMPEKFTLTHLMSVYEIILGEKLLPPAFRRKITDKIIPTDEFVRAKKFRPSRLYRFKGDENLKRRPK